MPLARGRVFEIGCGGRLNQSYYDRAAIDSFSGLDPSAKCLEFARTAAALVGRSADLREGVGEAIPFEAESFDTVICTFTLCSVADPARTLSELRRILRPGGQLLFAEHGRAPDAAFRTWQGRIEPV